MSPRLEFEPLVGLFEDDAPIPEGLLKHHVAEHFKLTHLTGVPDASLEITFYPSEGDDILIKRVDPEKALGYSVYAGEQDYFDRLSQELHIPTEEEVLGGIDG